MRSKQFHALCIGVRNRTRHLFPDRFKVYQTLTFGLEWLSVYNVLEIPCGILKANLENFNVSSKFILNSEVYIGI